MKKQKGLNALKRIRKLFPKVQTVEDADKSITITVTPEDSRTGRKKAPENCALARACVREKLADQAMIGIAYSYLIKGKVATRYKTSVAVGREITSFDRHQDFAAGKDYKLSKVSAGHKLGVKSNDKRGPHTTSYMPKPLAVHHTDNIRVSSH